MKRLNLTNLLVLSAIVCLTALWSHSRSPKPPSAAKPKPVSFVVDGLKAGTSLQQIRSAFQPEYRVLFKGEGEYELRGPGRYPSSTLIHVNKEEQVDAIRGTRLEREIGEKRLRLRLKEGREQWEYPYGYAWAERSSEGAESVGINSWSWSPIDTARPVRERSLLTLNSVTVGGIKLGMSKEHVGARLQESESWEAEEERNYWEGRATPETQLWSVGFKDDKANSISGYALEFRGERIVLNRSGLARLDELLGRTDDHHGYGPGGSLVKCWIEDEVVIEVIVLEDGEHGQVLLGDPRKLPRSHLWETGCGGI